ncbi:MAG: hypothetical protein ISR69_05380 [Gammaproteobacteria bacterium]|nr:hypothetical protein [Gammaproteobacteria bacterium]
MSIAALELKAKGSIISTDPIAMPLRNLAENLFIDLLFIKYTVKNGKASSILSLAETAIHRNMPDKVNLLHFT